MGGGGNARHAQTKLSARLEKSRRKAQQRSAAACRPWPHHSTHPARWSRRPPARLGAPPRGAAARRTRAPCRPRRPTGIGLRRWVWAGSQGGRGGQQASGHPVLAAVAGSPLAAEHTHTHRCCRRLQRGGGHRAAQPRPKPQRTWVQGHHRAHGPGVHQVRPHCTLGHVEVPDLAVRGAGQQLLARGRARQEGSAQHVRGVALLGGGWRS